MAGMPSFGGPPDRMSVQGTEVREKSVLFPRVVVALGWEGEGVRVVFTVERTFAWLGRNRRLAKDFERTIDSATAWPFLASVQLITKRVAAISPQSRTL